LAGRLGANALSGAVIPPTSPCEVRKSRRRRILGSASPSMAKPRTTMAKFGWRSGASAAGGGRLGPQVDRENVVSWPRGMVSSRRDRVPASSMITATAVSGRDAAVIPQQSAEPIDSFDATDGRADLVARRDNMVTDLPRSRANRGRDARARQRGPTETSSAATSPSTSRHGPPVAAIAHISRRAAPGNRRVGARCPSVARHRPISARTLRLL